MTAFQLVRQEERRALCSARVTLNGKPAVIRGSRYHFANVAALDGTFNADWAWETAARIVDQGGAFKL